MESNIKNLLRLFLDAIRDYEHENGDRITDDERESEEFVKIFLESEDAFDYKIILSEINRLKEDILNKFVLFVQSDETSLNWIDDIDVTKFLSQNKH